MSPKMSWFFFWSLLFAAGFVITGIRANGDPDCNHNHAVHELALGDSFLVQSFPAQYGRTFGWKAALSPQQCTWEFRSVGNCTLEFQTVGYKRGDVNCDEQYLLIGDEYWEQRICGFSKPPRHYMSSGSRLFLSRYRRNQLTIGVHISGTVRCLKGMPHRLIPYDNGTEPCPSICVTLPTFSLTNGFTGAIQLFDNGNLLTQATVPCTEKDGCTMVIQLCRVNGSISAVQENNGAVLKPNCLTAPSPTGLCIPGQAECEHTGNCDVVATRKLNAAPLVNNTVISCMEKGPLVCTFAYSICAVANPSAP